MPYKPKDISSLLDLEYVHVACGIETKDLNLFPFHFSTNQITMLYTLINSILLLFFINLLKILNWQNFAIGVNKSQCRLGIG